MDLKINITRIQKFSITLKNKFYCNLILILQSNFPFEILNPEIIEDSLFMIFLIHEFFIDLKIWKIWIYKLN